MILRHFSSPDLITILGPTLVSPKAWLDLIQLVSCAMKAWEALRPTDHQLLPMHLLSALNILHTPDVS